MSDMDARLGQMFAIVMLAGAAMLSHRRRRGTGGRWLRSSGASAAEGSGWLPLRDDESDDHSGRRDHRAGHHRRGLRHAHRARRSLPGPGADHACARRSCGPWAMRASAASRSWRRGHPGPGERFDVPRNLPQAAHPRHVVVVDHRIEHRRGLERHRIRDRAGRHGPLGRGNGQLRHRPGLRCPDAAGAARTAIPGATSAATGKPLLGEGILAGVLLLLGASGLAFARRRRADD